jgi:hypothetical protein
VFTAEDEDSVKYQVRAIKNVEYTRECYGFWRVQARPFPKEEPNIPNTAEHLRLNVTEVALGNANGK